MDDITIVLYIITGVCLIAEFAASHMEKESYKGIKIIITVFALVLGIIGIVGGGIYSYFETEAAEIKYKNDSTNLYKQFSDQKIKADMLQISVDTANNHIQLISNKNDSLVDLIKAQDYQIASLALTSRATQNIAQMSAVEASKGRAAAESIKEGRDYRKIPMTSVLSASEKLRKLGSHTVVVNLEQDHESVGYRNQIIDLFSKGGWKVKEGITTNSTGTMASGMHILARDIENKLIQDLWQIIYEFDKSVQIDTNKRWFATDSLELYIWPRPQ